MQPHRVPAREPAEAQASTLSLSPGALGFSMPAEWERHAASWLAWPHHAPDWPGKFAPIPWVYGEIVRHLATREQVCILVSGADERRRAERVLHKVGADLTYVDFFRIATDRVWTRDSGPIFVRHRDGRRLATLWTFNAWAKYPDYMRDARVGERIARAARVQTFRRAEVLEGGAVDVDGAGTLIATEECLLDAVQARNPGLGLRGTERMLTETLGVKRVVWLGRGIAGDDTHGHVDDVARFVGRRRVLLCEEKNPNDENCAILNENRERLQCSGLEVIPLPMPRPLFFDGRRVPASYANFYAANGIVLVPTFNDPADRRALGVIAECLPDREVVGIHCVDFVWGLGTIHCATQQEPA